MADAGRTPEEERAFRQRVGAEARELVALAVHRDALAFIAAADRVVVESFRGVEVARDAEGVSGPSYLQAFLAYSMRIAAAAIREALDDDDERVDDLLSRVFTALEIGDASS